MKSLASYIMRGRLEAMLTASTLAVLSLLFMPLIIISLATVALVTLRKGAIEGLIILASAALAAVIIATVIKVPYLLVFVFLAWWFPVWLIAIVLREGRHLSLALEIAVLIGITVIIGYYLYNTDPAALWKQVMPKMVPANAPVENVGQAIDQLAPFMTGVAAAFAVIWMLLGLLLGRWWQSILYNPGGFRQEFLGLKVQSSVALLTLVVIGIGMISGSGKLSQIAWNTTILLLVLYTFVGIAVGHSFFAKTKIAKLAVPMFYITLILIPHSILPVALVGFSDTWVDIRNRKF